MEIRISESWVSSLLELTDIWLAHKTKSGLVSELTFAFRVFLCIIEKNKTIIP